MPRPSRRDVLRVGSLSALGLTLPGLLRAETPARRPKSCIVIYQYGGLSQLDSWDPKPDAPAELRGPYKPIATRTPGFRVGELMPKLAARSDKYAVIRSMTHAQPLHHFANAMLLAGTAKPDADAPSFGAVVSKLKPSGGNLPSNVWLQKFGGGAAPPDPTYLTGGFLGSAHAPLLLGVSHDDNPANPAHKLRVFETDTTVSAERTAGRKGLLAKLDAGPPHLGPNTDTFREKAFDLLTGPNARRAFDIDKEPPPLRDRYGRNPLGQNLILARRLVEAGVRLVSVVAWTGMKPGEKFLSVETWDMHGNAGVNIFDDGWNGLGFALPRCDQAVSALLEDLSDRGLLDDTLVVLVGEFGRTPRISKGGSAMGRDHWPHCYSAMLAGGGVHGGAVYGASDKTAAYVKDDPVTLEDFSATLYHALGIDPATRLSPEGFTKPASTGKAIAALV